MITLLALLSHVKLGIEHAIILSFTARISRAPLRALDGASMTFKSATVSSIARP
jgi:hypothetical protein